MTDEIIAVKQLPIIVEQLQQIRSQVEDSVSRALSLECTEDTYKQVKEVRSQLNKDFKELEARRIEVKKKILAPYEEFEAVYKACITDVFKPAEKQLAERIAAVENCLKENKRAEIQVYFTECCASRHIDFLKLDDIGLNITLSASMKSLKEKVKSFVDAVSDDLAMISMQKYSAEILVEYKRSRSVSNAIMTVSNRHRAIEEERMRAEQAKAAERQKAETEAKVDEAIVEEVLSAPTVVETPPADESTAPASEHKIYSASFKVTTDKLDDLRALVAFMKERGINYEQF